MRPRSTPTLVSGLAAGLALAGLAAAQAPSPASVSGGGKLYDTLADSQTLTEK